MSGDGKRGVGLKAPNYRAHLRLYHFHRRRQCSISGSFMGVKRTSRKQVTVFFAHLKGSMELLAGSP